MGSSTIPSADNITDTEFQEYLGRYQTCLEAISTAKGAKDGQKTLAELDNYRYGAAIETFPVKSMTLDDVKVLVEWKLRHGKFRPTLMKLVSSNDAKTVKNTVDEAVKYFRDKADVSGALDILTRLKGIGPATASLLLAVHDADNVIFFADEAFHWLCCGGSKGPIKYNQKEYAALNEKSQVLAKRLGVKAVDVERVAFVLMRQGIEEKNVAAAPTAASQKTETRSSAEGANIKAKPLPAKRKASTISLELTPPPSRKDEMQSLSYSEPIQLTRRFSILKQGLVTGKEQALASSWERLLKSLSDEISTISSFGSQIVPTINFADINKPVVTQRFKQGLRQRGVAIIRNVIPRNTAVDLFEEAQDYLDENEGMAAPQMQHTHLEDIYWGHAQIKARAHPNVLAAQKFAMGLWTSKNSKARVATDFPVAYADRMRIWKGCENKPLSSPPSAHIDGGSVERWESDGYGRAGTYQDIFQGNWENYNPWESSTRLNVTSDLYHRSGACSIFRMYQGWLSLSSGPSALKVCPLPRHATAYFLLRPFFSPDDNYSSVTAPQNSILHGALPSYTQEINSTIHPHLQLENSLIQIPKLEPGDYLIWHPDLIHSFDTTTTSEQQQQPVAASVMYIPACPLTQTNALYLSRQRKAFLLGSPPPDFGGGRGESNYSGRPGVQEVNDAGGEEALRAMGLLPWDEEEADTDEEREVLAMANGILFPELYDML
ncbi:hypothetical protein QBC38DRAFT_508011 [Podospora fimiseda]|uniref:DUF1479 domain protein n=1 Tax=Podospora fimiseda TaxID=252190 RepID=A0AAN7BUE1_9PEZI|nr:hypothetical protein QBC38DRAFT_508011 [Podospora fimiseda]